MAVPRRRVVAAITGGAVLHGVRGPALAAEAAGDVPLRVASAQLQPEAGQIVPGPVVVITLDEASRALFGRITAANVGARMALRVDGETLVEAAVMEPIAGGVIHVTLPDDAARAKAIVVRLRAPDARVSVRVLPR